MHHRLITSLFALLIIAGCAKPQATHDTKQYSERDLNAAAVRVMVAHRSSRALAQMRVLEQLRGGSVTNAVEMIETELARDIEQLQAALKNSDPTNGQRGQIQGTVSLYEEYRARHPRSRTP